MLSLEVDFFLKVILTKAYQGILWEVLWTYHVLIVIKWLIFKKKPQISIQLESEKYKKFMHNISWQWERERENLDREIVYAYK